MGLIAGGAVALKPDPAFEIRNHTSAEFESYITDSLASGKTPILDIASSSDKKIVEAYKGAAEKLGVNVELKLVQGGKVVLSEEIKRKQNEAKTLEVTNK